MVPIGNLYYLLCYAWNRLDEKDFVEVEALPRQDLPNLLARILINGVKRLLRQGVDRIYIAHTQDSQNPKGKIDITDSLKRGLLLRNAVACVVDELSHNVLHNSIIRTTLHRLSSTAEVDPGLRHELRMLEKQLGDVSLVALRAEYFARVQLNRNNAFYRFLLHVCELCFFALLADERHGEYRFKDFIRDEVRMRKVFQDFVYNFYRIEQEHFTVSSERFDWDTTYVDQKARTLLPEMITDVCLDSSSRKIVIECKFTSDVLQENWGKLSARSEHLYQLIAYLKHLERRGGVHENCEGLLLYPTAAHPVDFIFDTQGHTVRVVTLDLRETWNDIRTRLLNLLNPWNASTSRHSEGPGEVPPVDTAQFRPG
jgi:5-methylcytosine-specific restriction enzyme subunit McrC